MVGDTINGRNPEAIAIKIISYRFLPSSFSAGWRIRKDAVAGMTECVGNDKLENIHYV